jgi:hypothetical protein
MVGTTYRKESTILPDSRILSIIDIPNKSIIGLPDPGLYPVRARILPIEMPESITIPKILLLPEKLAHQIDFCDSGIDETLHLTDMSSGILKGIIVGIVVGIVLLKMIK